MLDVTWEWIAIYEPALDLSNTVAVENGVEHDLLATDGEYARWAEAAARSPHLPAAEAAAIAGSRAGLLELRAHVRAVLAATAAASRLPRVAIEALNVRSAAAPAWLEIDDDGTTTERARGDVSDRLLAAYARSTMLIVADGASALRVCGAPSCGMFYRPRRSGQRWCSDVCGNRARFARHYARRGAA